MRPTLSFIPLIIHKFGFSFPYFPCFCFSAQNWHHLLLLFLFFLFLPVHKSHTPPTADPVFLFSPHQVAAPAFGPVKTHELLHHMTGKGLSAKYHFPRQLCLYQPGMVAVQVTLTNHSDHSLEQIHIGERSPAGLDIHCFNTVGEYRRSKVCPTIRLISAVGCWDSGNHQTFF